MCDFSRQCDQLGGQRGRIVAAAPLDPAPSSAATSAVSVEPSWYAATGARQPPPIANTHARSASTRRARLRVVDRRDELLLADTHLQRQRALARLGQQLLRLEALPDLVPEPEPVEPARREDDRVQTRARPACAAACRCSRAAARSRATARGRAAGPAGAQTPFRPASPAGAPGPAERVPRILPLQVRTDDQPVSVRRGHVLRRMHGDIDPAVEQRLLELLHEDPARRRSRRTASCGRGRPRS